MVLLHWIQFQICLHIELVVVAYAKKNAIQRKNSRLIKLQSIPIEQTRDHMQ